MRAAIPQAACDLSPAWLTGVLREAGALGRGAVVGVRRETLGEGAGFLGRVLRLHLTLEGAEPEAPRSLVAKLPFDVPRHRALGELLGVYQREIQAYRELLPAAPVRSPRCYYGAYDRAPSPAAEARADAFAERAPLRLLGALAGPALWLAARSPRRYLLLLEDLAPARPGDQVAGCGEAEARAAVDALAALHAAFWERPALRESAWLQPPARGARFALAMYRRSRDVFLRRYGARLPARAHRLIDWLGTRSVDVLHALSRPPFTLVHGDFRLDNLFFEPGTGRVAVVDWQMTGRGRGALDLAYFLSGNLDPALRARCEDALVARYHAALCRRGVAGYPLAACRRDVALGKVATFFQRVAGEAWVGFEGRGQALVDAWLPRIAAALPEEPFDRLLEDP